MGEGEAGNRDRKLTREMENARFRSDRWECLQRHAVEAREDQGRIFTSSQHY
jgi:hypothetical protein